MLRRETRLAVFASALILFLILFYQLNIQKNTVQYDAFEDTSMHKSTSYHKNAPGEYHFQPLPSSVINGVDRFVFFVGYARSGHSIIASMLDAHPNIVIAHEYALFTRWEDDPALHSNKTALFNALYNNSRYNRFKGLRSPGALQKGYTLNIPGWWQGQYSQRISIIGDKSGGMTAKVFRVNRHKFISLYHNLQSVVQIPIQSVHVVRNPYDNIASMVLYNEHQKKLVNQSKKYANYDALKKHITSYFNQVRSVVEMMETVKLSAIEVHHSDFIANPKSTIRRLCLLLHIDCSEEYIHQCAERVFTSESRTRHVVQWEPELIDLVAQNIQSYDHLKRYSFQS